MMPGGCISFKRERRTQRRNQKKPMSSLWQDTCGLGSRISHRFLQMAADAQSLLKIVASRPFKKKHAPEKQLSAKKTVEGMACACYIDGQEKDIGQSSNGFGGDMSHTRTSDSVLIPSADMKTGAHLEDIGCDRIDLEIMDVIGWGSHGTVYKAMLESSIVALKVSRNQMTHASSHSSPRPNHAPELELLKGMSHPNLVEILEVHEVYGDQCLGDEDQFDDAMSFDSDMVATPCYISKSSIWDDCEKSETWVIMEYCNQGSLWGAIQRSEFEIKDGASIVDYAKIIGVGLEIASAIEYLHEHGIIHGDLKAQNVMLQSSDRASKQVAAKVGDFGMCRRLKVDRLDMTTFSWGTVDHMAPETLQDGKLHFATDVYSFGILLMEMLTGHQPYKGMTTPAVIMAVVKGMRPKIPSSCPLLLMSLISDCWHQDWHKRPTFRVIAHRLANMLVQL